MNRTSLFLIFIFSLIILASCRKENTASNSNPDPVDSTNNNIDTTSGTYIDKVFYIDSTSAIQDTTSTTTFLYDNSRRVVWSYDSLKNGNIYEFYISVRYEYAGADTVPFKINEIVYESSTLIDSIVRYLSYDNTGHIKKDSMIQSSWNSGVNQNTQYIIKNYDYLPGKIYGLQRSQQIFPTTGAVAIINDTATLDANGNIITNIKNSYGNTRSVTSLSYDNKPNPLRNLSMVETGDIFPDGYASVYVLGRFKNNIIHVSDVRTGVSAGFDDLPIQITYGNNGYPATYVAAHLSTAGSYEKIAFHYRHF
ncbi:MAG: hypothetical protein ABI402_12940 [Ferruginibacter sp.]